jgi:hypothetical protein
MVRFLTFVLVNKDVEAWFHFLHSVALYEQRKLTKCIEELRLVQRIFDECGNRDGSRWVQFASLTFVNDVPLTSVPALKQLEEEFEKVEDWKGVQRCDFAITKIGQKAVNEAQYYTTLASMLQFTIGDDLK